MQRILTVADMRRSDERTIAGGIPGVELMGRAGRKIFEAVPWSGCAAVVCGSGNNGGDGYVLALELQRAGIPCRLFLLSERTSADGGHYFALCRASGIPWELCGEKTDFSGYDWVADCIFGTGFHGPAAGLSARIIEKINVSGARVVSADIPSGLSGDSGMAHGPCVRADITVSIGCPQPGHYLNMAKDLRGRLVNADIGIAPVGRDCRLLDIGDFRDVLRPRKHFSHKGDYGYVTLMGGCAAYSGAAKLANLSAAALRMGCGVATLAVPESIAHAVTPWLLESTLLPLPDRDGYMAWEEEAYGRCLSRAAALALGMGWGRGPDHEKILRYVLQHYDGPLVLDADGLNTLAELGPELLLETKAKPVLTPHLKEFSRLSGLSVADIQADPIRHAAEFAAKYRVIVLLKGPATVVTDGAAVYLTERGCPGMATAGSGDVLTGALTGLLGWAPCDAHTVACAACAAGLAGELAQEETGDISLCAGDTAAMLPKAIERMRKEGSDI